MVAIQNVPITEHERRYFIYTKGFVGDIAIRLFRGYLPPVSRWDAVRHHEGRENKNDGNTVCINGDAAKVREDGTVKTRSGRSAVPYIVQGYGVHEPKCGESREVFLNPRT